LIPLTTNEAKEKKGKKGKKDSKKETKEKKEKRKAKEEKGEKGEKGEKSNGYYRRLYYTYRQGALINKDLGYRIKEKNGGMKELTIAFIRDAIHHDRIHRSGKGVQHRPSPRCLILITPNQKIHSHGREEWRLVREIGLAACQAGASSSLSSSSPSSSSGQQSASTPSVTTTSTGSQKVTYTLYPDPNRSLHYFKAESWPRGFLNEGRDTFITASARKRSVRWHSQPTVVITNYLEAFLTTPWLLQKATAVIFVSCDPNRSSKLPNWLSAFPNTPIVEY